MVLNISPGGLAICTARAVVKDAVSNVRFKLPPSHVAIAVQGQIAWKAGSQRTLGISFLDLTVDEEQEIQRWLQSDPARLGPANEGRPKRVDWTIPILPPPPSLPANTAASQSAFPGQTGGSHRRLSVVIAPGPVLVEGVERHVNPPPDSDQPMDPPKPAAVPAGARGSAASAPPAAPGVGSVLSLGLEAWRAPCPPPPPHVEELPPGTGNIRVAILVCLLIAAYAVLRLTSEGGLVGAGQALWRASAQAWQAIVSPPAPRASELASDKWPVSPQPSPAPEASPPEGMGDQPQPRSDAPPAEAAAPAGPDSAAPAGPAAGAMGGESAVGRPPVDRNPSRTGKVPTGTVSVLSQARAIRVPAELRSSRILRHGGLRLGESLIEQRPDYPPDALRKRVEGMVKIHAVIGRDGRVASANVETGPALLAGPSLAAIRGWRYEPSLLGSRAVEWEEEITLVFRLRNASVRRR
jgi:outer membrane biosynthesis protein TonB